MSKAKLKKRPIKTTVEKEKGKDPLNIAGNGLRLAWITFIDEYIKNGGNGTEAYMVAYPESSRKAAKDNASRLIAKDSIREEIDNKLTTQKCTEEFIVSGLMDIAVKYRGAKTIMAAVKSLEILSKIKGMLVDTKKIAFTSENPALFTDKVSSENKVKFAEMVKNKNRIAE